MRRTTLKPQRLHQLAQEYLSSRPAAPPNPRGGRPRTYDDALILTIAFIQNLNNYSFREALEYCEDYFADLPALSSYHERLTKFTPDIAQGFIAHIGRKISMIAKQAPPRGRVFVKELSRGKGYVLGDKGFDSHRIMAAITGKGYRSAIPVKRGRFGRRIKDPLREELQKNAENRDIYKQRILIEGLFGEVKQKLSSHVRIFKLNTAQTFALLRLALLNASVLVSLENVTVWLWFPNSAIICHGDSQPKIRCWRIFVLCSHGESFSSRISYSLRFK